MPQSGTETTIESIDEGFQVRMVEMLKQTGRNEIVVGWYHSHPGKIINLIFNRLWLLAKFVRK